ncbi:MAG: S1C family serine protease [Acidiferrobacterales bacterium]
MKARLIVLLATLVLLAAFKTVQAGALGELFKRVSGSAVVILTEEKVLHPELHKGKRVSVAGLGSGVLISADGKVLTAAHVVQAVDRVAVQFADGEVVVASIVTSDPPADVALLQLERVPAGAVVAKLGDSDRAEVADEIFVIGAPYGFSHTLTVGHISARRAPGGEAEELPLAEFFQTDAAVNEGNSGGPMFNLNGEVIGIVSHILTQSGGFEGLGFAVTSNTARRLVLERPAIWSGMQGYLLTGEIAALLNLPQAAGFLVLQVAEGSPAARIGLRAGTTKAQIGDAQLILGGDIILEVVGLKIKGSAKNYERIREKLRKKKPGERVVVKVLREGQVIKLSGHRSQ